ncbi:LodA/GoxA family CTQ-dependent oxidase [Marinomonas shanghaiensis]|uniref:LodA/GoxA family CTQ-dependent oxidase n=1 Tax=Marinomonas shanghaiensis TaxID=2202418 RepID=UPI003A90F487
MSLSIHPSVGVARLGNADGNDFVLNPIKIGGLPYEHDDNLQPTTDVIHFKDEAGRVRRQGQVFKVLDEQGNEITLGSANVKSIEWRVHLANKKAAWYAFSELNGNLLYGEENSYKNRGIEWRNVSVTSEPERQKLIIDLGPRSVSGSLKSAEFDKDNIPSNYTKASYPGPVLQGEDFKSLGTLLTDDKGRLIVLGGYGRAGGNTDLEGYGGGDE